MGNYERTKLAEAIKPLANDKVYQFEGASKTAETYYVNYMETRLFPEQIFAYEFSDANEIQDLLKKMWDCQSRLFHMKNVLPYCTAFIIGMKQETENPGTNMEKPSTYIYEF